MEIIDKPKDQKKSTEEILHYWTAQSVNLSFHQTINLYFSNTITCKRASQRAFAQPREKKLTSDKEREEGGEMDGS